MLDVVAQRVLLELLTLVVAPVTTILNFWPPIFALRAHLACQLDGTSGVTAMELIA